MDVTLLTGHLSDAAGGFAVSVPGMARALEVQGNARVRIVGLQDPRAPEAWKKWGSRVAAVSQSGPRALGFAKGMVGALAEGRPDVVDAQGLWMYPSWASLAWFRRHRKPYVVTPRGMLDPWAVARSSHKKKLAYWAFEREHLAAATCLRATSELEATHMRAFGLRNPIAVIPNAIDVPAPIARHPQSRRRVLFLSRLHEKKGIDLLLAAWARIEPQFASWDLVIAGPDEDGYGARMRAYSAEMQLDRVSWMGNVTGEAKAALYRSADLFVLPTRGENFGLVVAEALAHETPVITTREAPWAELGSHGCGWWIDLSIDALSNAMTEAMLEPQNALQARGRKGRAWMARDYGWDNLGSKLHLLYGWVAGRSERPAFVRD